jgi:hypothetical protein
VRRWRTPAAACAFTHAGSSVRVDSGVREGDFVGTNYDPMIAKIIATGARQLPAQLPCRPACDPMIAKTIAAAARQLPPGPPAHQPACSLACPPALPTCRPCLGRARPPLLATWLLVSRSPTCAPLVSRSPPPRLTHPPRCPPLAGADRDSALANLRQALAQTQVRTAVLCWQMYPDPPPPRPSSACPGWVPHPGDQDVPLDPAATPSAPLPSTHRVQVAGLPTNMTFLQRLAAHPAFIGLELDTGFIGRHGEVRLFGMGGGLESALIVLRTWVCFRARPDLNLALHMAGGWVWSGAMRT